MQNDANQLSVLSHQNQTLAFQLEEKQRNEKILIDQVKDYEDKENGYRETLLCVGRIWDQLQEDIRFMCNDALLASTSSTGPDNDANNPPTTDLPFSPSTNDPFLTQLLLGCSGSTAANGKSTLPSLKSITDDQKQINSNLTDVEEALAKKAASTQRSLSLVLSRVEGLWRSRNTSDAMEVDNPPSTSQEASSEALIASLRQQVAHGHSAYRTASDRAKIAEGRAMESDEQITRLRNELADTEQQLSSLQRKHATLTQHATLTSTQTLSSLVKTEREEGSGGLVHAGSCLAMASSLGINAGPSSLPLVVNGVPAHEHDAAMEEVKQLHQLLESRSSELERERENHMKTKRDLIKTKRDLDEAIDKITDEAGVSSTRTFSRLQRELHQSMESLKQRSSDLEAALSERDHATREAQSKMHVSAELLTVKREMQSLRSELETMRSERLKADKVKQDLELRLHRETQRANESSSQSYTELLKTIASMHLQLKACKEQLQLGGDANERLEASAREVAECSGRIEVRRLQSQRLQEKVMLREEELRQGDRKQEELKDRIRDLEAFVQVLTHDSEETREIDEIRASEISLGSKIKELEAKLEGHELHWKIREMEARVREANDRTDLAILDADSLRAEMASHTRHLSEMERVLADSQGQCSLFRNEMQSMERACEELQVQNERLIDELAKKEGQNNRMVTEEFATVGRQRVLEAQCEQAAREVAMLKKDYGEVINLRELMERQAGDLSRELARVKEQSRQHASRAEAAAVEISRRDEALTLAAESLESLKKQLADLSSSLEETQAQLNKEKTKKKKVDDELKLASAKLDRHKRAFGGSAAGSGDKGLTAEVEAMRQIIYCNVCHEKQKNTVIVKCGHVFCNSCIQKRVDGRDRKCPRCGIVFSKDEVKSIHL